MSYTVEFQAAVERQLAALAPKMQARVMTRIRALATNPRPRDAKPLTGDLKGRFKLRVGDYRVIYTIHHDVLQVLVLAVGHRSKVYGEAARKE